MFSRETIRAITLLIISSFGGAGLAFLIQVLLARHLGPSEYGVFSTAMTHVTLLTPLAGFGLAQFWLRIFSEEGLVGIRWIAPSLRYAVLTCIATIAFLMGVVLLQADPSLTSLVLWLVILIPSQIAIDLTSSKLQLEERYTKLSLWQAATNTLRFLGVSALYITMRKSLSAQEIAALFSFVGMVLSIPSIIAIRALKADPAFPRGHPTITLTAKPNPPPIWSVATRCAPFGLAMLLYLIYFQSGILVVRFIAGNQAAGIYNVAFCLLSAIYIFPTVIYQKFLVPKIHRWSLIDLRHMYNIFRKGNLAMLSLGTVAALFSWFTAPLLVQGLFGRAYDESIPIFQIMSVACPFVFLAFSSGAMLVTHHHMWAKVRLMAVVATISIPLTILLTSLYGVKGASIALVTTQIFLCSIYLYYSYTVVFRMFRD